MLKVAWFYWKFIQNQKEVNKTYENGEITQHMWCALRRWIEWVAPIEVNLLTTKTRQFKAKANIHWFFIRNNTTTKNTHWKHFGLFISDFVLGLVIICFRFMLGFGCRLQYSYILLIRSFSPFFAFSSFCLGRPRRRHEVTPNGIFDAYRNKSGIRLDAFSRISCVCAIKN